MKFYNRKKELELLRRIEKTSQVSSKMTVIVGRRRIGKTKLVQKAFDLFFSESGHLY
ncbi:MAG: ATP-binding protein [Desulfuromusa sp.]|nr:ATP-binding protein [Desulfuromusa sp.]